METSKEKRKRRIHARKRWLVGNACLAWNGRVAWKERNCFSITARHILDTLFQALSYLSLLVRRKIQRRKGKFAFPFIFAGLSPALGRGVSLAMRKSVHGEWTDRFNLNPNAEVSELRWSRVGTCAFLSTNSPIVLSYKISLRSPVDN